MWVPTQFGLTLHKAQLPDLNSELDGSHPILRFRAKQNHHPKQLVFSPPGTRGTELQGQAEQVETPAPPLHRALGK